MIAKTTIMIIEDDPNIVDLLRSNLVMRGFGVVVSTTGADALALLADYQPDVALVDLMLPGHDGFELCKLLRERSELAIIVISARGREDDKVKALNLGADDYLTKPFGIDELLARIHATLRRSRPPKPDDTPSVIAIRQLVIDLDAQSVTREGVPVRLTPTEFALLREFVTNPGKLLTHAVLLRRVWGAGYATETEYTRVYVGRLRAKLEAPGTPPLIVTEPRQGYRLIAQAGNSGNSGSSGTQPETAGC